MNTPTAKTSRLQLQILNVPYAGKGHSNHEAGWMTTGWSFATVGAWKRGMAEHRFTLANHEARLVAGDGSVVWTGGNAPVAS